MRRKILCNDKVTTDLTKQVKLTNFPTARRNINNIIFGERYGTGKKSVSGADNNFGVLATKFWIYIDLDPRNLTTSVNLSVWGSRKYSLYLFIS